MIPASADYDRVLSYYKRKFYAKYIVPAASRAARVCVDGYDLCALCVCVLCLSVYACQGSFVYVSDCGCGWVGACANTRTAWGGLDGYGNPCVGSCVGWVTRVACVGVSG